MRYRKAEKEDVAQLALLFDGYRAFYRKRSDVKGAETFLMDRLSLGDSEIFVAENPEENLLGFVQLYPLLSSTRMQKLWLLNDLFVSPGARGKGISVNLIEKAKQLVKETEAAGMFLETEKTNMIGNNLYPKTGFELNEGSNYYEWSFK